MYCGQSGYFLNKPRIYNSVIIASSYTVLAFPHYVSSRPGFISSYDLLSWHIIYAAVVDDRKL